VTAVALSDRDVKLAEIVVIELKVVGNGIEVRLAHDVALLEGVGTPPEPVGLIVALPEVQDGLPEGHGLWIEWWLPLKWGNEKAEQT